MKNNMHKIRMLWEYVSSVIFLLLINIQLSFSQSIPLDSRMLTKFIDELPRPGIMQPVSANYYEIGVYQKMQQLHSQLPPTIIWGYGTSQATAGYPGATIKVLRGIPIQVKWTNNLTENSFIIHPMPVDQTLHWADPLDTGYSYERYFGPVPVTVHVHGCEVEPQSDGNPESWFTPGFAIRGPGWVKEVFDYNNSQPATTLWYHDHAFGITRLNVYMGLAGFYIIQDPLNEPQNLPQGMYEIPIVIQDRMFNPDGSLLYPDEGINPTIHPFWIPEFFGNTILVNGKVWPYLNVEPRKYRFRLLNGSNARFYNLKLAHGLTFMQIGTDGGYLEAPVKMNHLLLAPGERADVIVDFSRMAVGTQILMSNNAKAPYPSGEVPDPNTVGEIMQFRIIPLSSPDTSSIPSSLNQITRYSNATVTRTLTLNEVEENGEPSGAFLDGKEWGTDVTELPHQGDTEIWELVNLTGDAHPIHLHLVQFQLLNRQKFNVRKYLEDYEELNPIIPAEETINPPVANYLQGPPKDPEANEMGWKDTYKVFPGDVTRFIIRFAPYGEEAITPFPFEVSAEPGYEWHCHILEHEDNEMMRPMKIATDSSTTIVTASDNERTSIKQNYPNPFNPVTSIVYEIGNKGYVVLKVYDVLGKEVSTLIDNVQESGKYKAQFDGAYLSSGVYYYKLTVNYLLSGHTSIETKRMILLK